ncbi:MAG: hydantoinase B/oxoprolinase family protein [Alphaproteobacteria bacterium]|nr:hydantoinase B/oxoprolinase family protein [Alphaproteobacteria bacterium]
MTTVDPITLEIIQNKLVSVVAQISTRLVRSGRSFLIKEMEDCSSALFDRDCRLLAESANIPIHLNCVGICLQSVLDHYIPRESWAEGDVVIANDPYLGGSLGSAHTNDIIMFHPVFVDGELEGFAGLMAHHMDIGSTWMGTRGWGVEIHQEGMLIPPLKIVERNEINEALFALMLRNSRVPEIFGNDLRAQMESLRASGSELADVFHRYGRDTTHACIDALVEYGERRARQEIESIADGVYCNETPVLDDGAKGGPYWLRVEITKTGSDITFDFTGTDKQIAGPINAPLSATMSAVYYIMRCLTDPTVPNSEGCKRPIHVIAPEGTLVNAREPAAVYQRMLVCHSLVDLIMGALADAAPERVIADSCGCQYNYVAVLDPQTDRRVMFGEVPPGGIGATSRSDGIEVMSCHVTNCAIPPVEATEIEAPMLFLKREYQQDTGGAGRRRGGVGQVMAYRILGDDPQFHHTSQKSVSLPQGLHGGQPGAGGRWVINEGRNGERTLDHAVGDIEMLGQGDTVTFYSSAGGGFGHPHEREPSRVLDDVRAGLVSRAAAESVYGVRISSEKMEIVDVRRDKVRAEASAAD